MQSSYDLFLCSFFEERGIPLLPDDKVSLDRFDYFNDSTLKKMGFQLDTVNRKWVPKVVEALQLQAPPPPEPSEASEAREAREAGTPPQEGSTGINTQQILDSISSLEEKMD